MQNIDIEAINAQIRIDSAFLDDLKKETQKVIVGQEKMLDRLLLGLLTNGHVLLEGLPGLAKTMAIKALSKAINARFSRIQFTPDLLPADIIGTMPNRSERRTQNRGQQTCEFSSTLGRIRSRCPARPGGGSA